MDALYPKKEGNQSKKKFFIFFISFLLLFFIISQLFAIWRFANGALSAKSSLERTRDFAISLQFQEARSELSRANESLKKADSGLLFMKWMAVIPWLGDQWQALSIVFDAGEQALFAFDEVLIIAEDVYAVIEDAEELIDLSTLENDTASFTDYSDIVKSNLLEELHYAYPELQEISIRLDLVQKELDGLEQLTLITELSDLIQPLQEAIPQLQMAVDILIPISGGMEGFAGINGDKQWLLLFLNNMELRPGGGFIGVFGLGTMQNGELIDLSVNDSFSVDAGVQYDDAYQTNPPDALRTYLGVDKWYFRDANWSPDFAQSAQDTIQLLRQEIAHIGEPVPEIHGVLGFTPTIASQILEVVGDITIDDVTFTPENLPLLLEYEVEFAFIEKGIDQEDRKEIVAKLTDEVIDRLLTLPITEYPDIFAILQNAIIEKQMAVYSTNEQAQFVFEDADWAGHIDIDQSNDILMFVDANLAALKSDPALERKIEYTIRPDLDGYIAEAKMQYQHNGTFDLFTTRYRTYTRLFVPQGSELIAHSGSMLNDLRQNPSNLPGEVAVQDELGMTSFGTFISIEPGESGTLSFTYRLPKSIEQKIDAGAYELDIFKQMGAKNHALTLDLDFDKNILSALPGEDEKDFGDQAYSIDTILNQNQSFLIEF